MMLFFIVLLLLLPHAADGAEICCLNCHICHKHIDFCSLPREFLRPAQRVIFDGRLEEFLPTAERISSDGSTSEEH